MTTTRRRVLSPLPRPEGDQPERVMMMWEVKAGLNPGGQPEGRLERHFHLLPHEVERPDYADIVAARRGQAYEYAASLSDQQRAGWVRVDWQWWPYMRREESQLPEGQLERLQADTDDLLRRFGHQT